MGQIRNLLLAHISRFHMDPVEWQEINRKFTLLNAVLTQRVTNGLGTLPKIIGLHRRICHYSNEYMPVTLEPGLFSQFHSRGGAFRSVGNAVSTGACTARMGQHGVREIRTDCL